MNSTYAMDMADPTVRVFNVVLDANGNVRGWSTIRPKHRVNMRADDDRQAWWKRWIG